MAGIGCGHYFALSMRQLLLFLSIIFLNTAVLKAQLVFDFTPGCMQAYQSAISLKLNEAQQLSNQEKQRNANNLVPFFIDNYIDFFVLFFNENPADLKRLSPNKDKRLQLMEAGPSNSPFTLFSQAIIQLQWAAVDVKFGNRWNSGWAFRDAFKLAKQNQQLFPDFTPNLMITGPLQMAASTIPKNYRWLSNMVGIKGTMQQGRNYLNTFINSRDPWAQLFMNEGIFYQCYTQFYLLNQPAEALSFIKSRQLDVINNHLFAYMAAHLHLNNKESYLTEAIVLNRNKGAEYLSTPIWDFELGYAKLYRLSPDAGQYLERFLNAFKGKFYVKEVTLKLAWFYLLQGNMAQYKKCIANVIKNGASESDADKRANKEATIGKIPNVVLLKSRLLNDGGYNKEALNLLAGKTNFDFADETERLEFTYRVGRIYDDLGRYEEAIKAYEVTINTGRKRTEYFAARSALQIGLIYEKKGKNAQAITYYKTCINMEGHDYEDSLEQKAKAGIIRCGGTP